MKDTQVKDLTLRLFKMETDRDKQRKVGASQISDPCTYHLAKALTNAEEAPAKYWLGGKIGTATHMLLEDSIAKASLKDFPELEGCMVEQKITLGELEGYGTVSSKPDLVLVKENHLIDWKTSTRDKARKLLKVLDAIENNLPIKDTGSFYTFQKYIAQVQLYAWGLNQSGIKVDNCSLVFVNRDGTTEADIFTYTFDYSEELALAIWHRLESLWASIQSGVDIETLDKDGDCFKCAIGI